MPYLFFVRYHLLPNSHRNTNFRRIYHRAWLNPISKSQFLHWDSRKNDQFFTRAMNESYAPVLVRFFNILLIFFSTFYFRTQCEKEDILWRFIWTSYTAILIHSYASKMCRKNCSKAWYRSRRYSRHWRLTWDQIQTQRK